jgi:hypothetical protein
MPKTTKRRRRKAGFDMVADVARVIPDVEETASPRGRGLKLRGKLLACQAIHKSAEPNSLMVRIDSGERDALLTMDPDTYYLTDHYRGYPAVLVRLSKVHRKALGQLLEMAAEFVNAKKRRTRS